MPIRTTCTQCHQWYAYPDGTPPTEMICPTCRIPLQIGGEIGRAPSRTNGVAIAALVLGLLSVSCLWGVASIPAVVCGVVALVQIRNSHGHSEGNALAIGGLILGSLSILALGALVAVSVFAVGPAMNTLKATSRQVGCQATLQQLYTSMEMYRADNGAYPQDDRGPLASLALLYPDYVYSEDAFLCMAADPSEAPTFPEGTSLAGEICCYEYVMESLNSKDDPATLPLLRDRTANHGDYPANVVFMDGHVATQAADGTLSPTTPFPPQPVPVQPVFPVPQ